MVWDEDIKTFIMHIAELKTLLAGIIIYFSQETQIAALQYDKAFTKILLKYTDYTDIFLHNLTIELP